MQDRIPTPGQEGRVLITPEDGGAPFYAKVEMADNPTQDGMPLNKENLLQDSTCILLDLPVTSVPNDAFAKLALGAGNYGYLIKVQDSSGNPVKGMTVNGIFTITGETAITDDDGEVLGVSTATQVSVSVTSPYFDLGDASQVVDSTGIITQVNLTMPTLYSENQAVTLRTSATLKFSPFVEYADFCLIGAGGGSGANDNLYGGAGGGGGYVTNVLNQQISTEDSYELTIGAGGSDGFWTGSYVNPGGTGGTTTLKKNGSIVGTANGGGGGNAATDKGGVGNGNGGAAYTSVVLPTAGTGYLFNEQSLGLAGGGGGGSGASKYAHSGAVSGASPYGANGSSINSPGISATGPGGGAGGAGYYTDGQKRSGGTGGDGAIIMRMRYAP